MSYTPGPWKWDDDGNLRGKSRNAIFFTLPRTGDRIADLVNHSGDAALISAAPDLLEALEAVVADADLRGRMLGDTYHAVTEALSKAKGEGSDG